MASVKLLVQRAEDLFGKRGSLMSLYQEIGENFYPQRADFTLTREIGETFGDNLSTSYPLQVQRELTDQIGQMLRPTAKPWFHISTMQGDRLDIDSKRWLERNETIQRRAMYDINAMLARATKEGDADFSTFGQAAMSVRLNRARDGLLYRTYHLRDMAWVEDDDGKICFVARRWRPSNYDLVYKYKTFKLHQEVKRKVDRHPFELVNCVHIVCKADMYDDNARGMPRVSIYYDLDHKQEMEVTPTRHREYIIPRWQTVSGSQYAYSPATVIGLPDARLLQAMTYTLLEAGENIVRPPLLATQDVVRSDIALYSGGVTWIDAEYDEKMGAAIRPLVNNPRAMPIGIDMQRDARTLLHAAFYLNKLQLPERNAEMTAYEVGQRIQEWIRQALPIFEPMEQDYNGQLCEETYNVLLYAGAFGSPLDIPKRLQGAEILFKFRSPLHDAIEAARGQKFLESKALIGEAMQLDQGAIAVMDANEALRDALEGTQTPANWIRSETSAKQIRDAQAAAAQAQTALEAAKTGSEAAKNLAGAGIALGGQQPQTLQ